MGRKAYRKKRKFELGRPAAMTRVCAPGQKRVRRVRTRGGHSKFRALRLDSGNYSWATESVAKKTRVIKVVYSATSNELVRTNTLMKNAIVQIDATPFRQWFESHYGVPLGAKKAAKKPSAHLQRKLNGRGGKDKKIDPALLEQFSQGRLLACISSRPGQSGRADGYILED